MTVALLKARGHEVDYSAGNVAAVVEAIVNDRGWLQGAAVYRWVSRQYDDDRNMFKLAPATQFDVRLFGTLRSFTWQVTVENATDERIEVGRTPLVTLAAGRAVRAGVTWRR